MCCRAAFEECAVKGCFSTMMMCAYRRCGECEVVRAHSELSFLSAFLSAWIAFHRVSPALLASHPTHWPLTMSSSFWHR